MGLRVGIGGGELSMKNTVALQCIGKEAESFRSFFLFF